MKFIKKLFGQRSEEAVDNSRLLRAMHEVAVNDSHATRKQLYELFLDCQFYIPVPELPEGLRKPDASPASEPIHIGLRGFLDHNGNKTTPAFTDAEALQNWDPNTPSIIIPSMPYFQMVRDTKFQRIAINPYDPIRKMLRPGGFITRRELEALAEGWAPISSSDTGLVKLEIKKGQKVLIGQPANPPPPEILQRLMDTAKAVPDLEALYLAQIDFPNGQAQIVIGVDIGDRDKQQYEQAIRRVGEQVEQLAPALNFCPLNTAFGQDIKRLGRKFWSR
ncbi:MAG: hypothetical protein DMG65_07325 [Candidatus Angelobacter sp. Gp1-AA117]|nr:MAG: hypothetical protein DMG65_07325 [Candidatus Angelobacter sp. Gp1-AA117]